jgi:hypothetical protein
MLWSLLTVFALIAFTACGGEGYEVLPPDASVAGVSTVDLMQTYGKSVIETPLDQSWLGDPNHCDNGASTDAIYFAPTFPAPGESSASCTMRSEQVLYLNPVAVFCVEGVDDAADTTCLDEFWNLTSSSVTIDGVEVHGLEERQHDTPAFDVTLPEGNIFDEPAGATRGIWRGQVVLIDGLDPGEHEVVLAGDFGDGEFAGSLTIDMTVE